MDATDRRVLARWFQILATKGVDELVFVNRPWPLPGLPLPSSLFSCASLSRLCLGAWVFPNTTALPRGAGFPNLRELVLGCVVMKDKDLEFLLAVSPVLEMLAFHGSLASLQARIANQSLRCAQFCLSILEEVAMVNAPSLERLFLWRNWSERGRIGAMSTTVKIGHAPKLRVLGYLEPGVHILQIGSTIIKAISYWTEYTSFLEENTSNRSLKFWQETSPIECVQSHLKTLSFCELQGNDDEFDFIMFIVENALKLERLIIQIKQDLTYTERQVVVAKLGDLSCANWANTSCKVRFEVSTNPIGSSWSIEAGSDLSSDDPFSCL
uniref:Uncharacterized protein n=1 Tax=Aegilops tauschii TaxID=37682 RepID=N1QP90_AEGTA